MSEESEKKDSKDDIYMEKYDTSGSTVPQVTLGRWGRIWEYLCSIGRAEYIERAAHTQIITESGQIDKRNVTTYAHDVKPTIGGRIFDAVTVFAGSKFMFLLTLVLLIVWASLGGYFHGSQDWQIVLQDTSSIQSYVSDTLLMRQQRNQCHDMLVSLVRFRSRSQNVRRMLREMLGTRTSLFPHCENKEKVKEPNELAPEAIKLPAEHWFDYVANFVAAVVGSLLGYVVYWAGIFVWIGFGKSMGWSNNWQLWINSATAVYITFICMFLQHIRHMHMCYLEECMNRILFNDARLELLARYITKDDVPNKTLVCEPMKVGAGVRAIDYYADVIATGIGVAISTVVFVVWIAIGHPMQFNSNWWLIIGTYTGLIGFFDGFVLRNVFLREDIVIDREFERLFQADRELFETLHIDAPPRTYKPKQSLSAKISYKCGYYCSVPESVLVGILVVVGLLVIASAMRWNETGQLLCNTPTMIIEGFFLTVLLEAHNGSDDELRENFRDVLVRRLVLLNLLEEAYPECKALMADFFEMENDDDSRSSISEIPPV